MPRSYPAASERPSRVLTGHNQRAFHGEVVRYRDIDDAWYHLGGFRMVWASPLPLMLDHDRYSTEPVIEIDCR